MKLLSPKIVSLKKLTCFVKYEKKQEMKYCYYQAFCNEKLLKECFELGGSGARL